MIHSTQSDIAETRALLGAALWDRNQVGRFLTLVRKLAENMGDRYRVLRFYCSWPQHARMDHSQAWEILGVLNSYAKARSIGDPAAEQILNKIRPFISFEPFRDGLVQLLMHHGLPPTPLMHPSLLRRFLQIYVELIRDSPLLVDSKKLSHLDNVVVNHQLHPVAPLNDGVFVMGWRWLLRKQEAELVTIYNELWLPAQPLTRQIKIAKLDIRNGKMVNLPVEANSFWARP